MSSPRPGRSAAGTARWRWLLLGAVLGLTGCGDVSTEDLERTLRHARASRPPAAVPPIAPRPPALAATPALQRDPFATASAVQATSGDRPGGCAGGPGGYWPGRALRVLRRWQAPDLDGLLVALPDGRVYFLSGDARIGSDCVAVRTLPRAH